MVLALVLQSLLFPPCTVPRLIYLLIDSMAMMEGIRYEYKIYKISVD